MAVGFMFVCCYAAAAPLRVWAFDPDVLAVVPQTSQVNVPSDLLCCSSVVFADVTPLCTIPAAAACLCVL
jgi:hypothetical protein